MRELGYDAEQIVNKATPLACSEPFRVLSQQDAATLLPVCRRLRSTARGAGDRIERMTRGGCYRSRWLRDLCTSVDLAAHLGEIYGIAVAPHAMPLNLGHINYEPEANGAAVDKWHHDTLRLDIVMMVTDPNSLYSGHFEWFHGTRDEAGALAAAGKTPSPESVRAPVFLGLGYAIALHGDMVVHRGAALDQPGERITTVNGYFALDAMLDEQSCTRELVSVDDPNLVWTEWARFVAWRSSGRVNTLVGALDFGVPLEEVISRLEHAVEDVQRATEEMRDGEMPTTHCGG